MQGMMPVGDTAPQASEERFAFLGVKGALHPCAGVKGGRREPPVDPADPQCENDR